MSEREDATRRTHLANERTYLAWWRSGLTAFAAAIGLGRIVPELTTRSKVLDTVGGIGFAVLGVVFVVYGTYRERSVRAALDRGEFSHLDPSAVVLFAVAGIALGVLVVTVILVSS